MNKITKDFYINNRNKLIESIPNTLIVIPAHSMLQSSADTTYPFRQDSNFWYLTGINEPDLLLLVDTKSGESSLVLPERNDYQNQWDGAVDTKNLQNLSGIKVLLTGLNLASKIEEAVVRGQNIGYLKPLDELVQPYGFYSNPSRRKLEEELLKTTDELVDVRLDIARLRQIKQPEEIQLIQKAIDITGDSLKKVKSNLSKFNLESEINSYLTAEFYSRRANGHGYEPIIASSKNAAVIHYNHNNQPIKNDSLILLDVGASYGMYSADISRTWAVGNPSKRQQDVYNAVLEIQNKAISMLKPGVLLKQYQLDVEDLAKKAMKELDCSNAEEKYPHGFSHFLGLDVHDAGDYQLPLSEGMILTVEPGIYLQDEGIGVRIEDNILITKSGNRVLSEKIPRYL